MWFMIACARVRWEDVPVLDERAAPEPSAVAQVEAALGEFQAVAVIPAARLDAVHLVDAIAPSGSFGGGDLPPAGRYDPGTRALHLAAGAFAIRHELCHALDETARISMRDEDFYAVEALPTDIPAPVHVARTENEEVFATLCEPDVLGPIVGVLQATCPVEFLDPRIVETHARAFPGAAAVRLSPVDLSVAWTPLTWTLDAAAVAGGALLIRGHVGDDRHATALVAFAPDGWSEVVQDGALGFSEPSLRPLPSDGARVELCSHGQLIDYAADPPAVFEVGADRVGHGAVLGRIAVVHDREADVYLRVDLDTGERRAFASPAPVEPFSDTSLVLRGSELLRIDEDRAWRFTGEGWEPIEDGPLRAPREGTSVARLADGGQVVAWQAVEPDPPSWAPEGAYHAGLALRTADGAVALSFDACGEPLDVDLVTDGEVVWALQDDRVGVVPLP